MTKVELPPITVTVNETCRITGLKLSSIYKKLADETLKSTSIGKRRLILYDSIVAMIEAGRSLPSETRPNWTPPSPALRRAKAEPVAPPRIIRRRVPVPTIEGTTG
jgi:predicted DNA-binding transcriptional regulator AlpA